MISKFPIIYRFVRVFFFLELFWWITFGQSHWKLHGQELISHLSTNSEPHYFPCAVNSYKRNETKSYYKHLLTLLASWPAQTRIPYCFRTSVYFVIFVSTFFSATLVSFLIVFFLAKRSLDFSFLFSSRVAVIAWYFQPTSCARRPSTANWKKINPT